MKINGEYGVVPTAAVQCIVFETGPEGSLTRWEHVEDVTTLENAFEAVAVGVSMQRRGLIT